MNLSRVAVGICAYNEENNIGNLLQNLIFEQKLPRNCKILVVCSGCTDRTPQIVKKFRRKDARIEPIIDKVRRGKANALNKIFEATGETADVLVLVNADALPEHGSITKLISKLLYSNAGAVFARPIPFKEQHGFSHKIAEVIWHLHHIISLFRKPKLSGELCVIRTSCFRGIPEDTPTDEPYIELAIRRQGYDILYVPEAIVYTRCPTNVIDLLKHRERIWTGHMQLHNNTGFKVSTSSLMNVLLAIPALRGDEIFYALLGGLLELIAYFGAKIALNKGIIPYIWEPIRSTKT